MTLSMHNFLLILAVILAVLAGLGVTARVQLGWFALACLALALLVVA